MSDEDYFVRNSVDHLIDDLNPDAGYSMLTEPQRIAVLLWVLDGLVRTDGVSGFVDSLGARLAVAPRAMWTVGAEPHAAILDRMLPLMSRAPEQMTPQESQSWSELEAEFLAALNRDDLVDNYLRPFIQARPADFPQSVDDL